MVVGIMPTKGNVRVIAGDGVSVDALQLKREWIWAKAGLVGLVRHGEETG